MKLNKTRPYGVVTGHATASFEQDGVLFDGAGEQLAEHKPPAPSKKLAAKTAPVFETLHDKQLANAKAFLENLLSGGPIDKSVVYKEAEGNNQRWDTVKLAFNAMNCKTTKLGNATLWSLSYEQAR